MPSRKNSAGKAASATARHGARPTPRKATAADRGVLSLGRKDVADDTAFLTPLPRTIDRAVERELWARAAGRCEFDGCNKLLWRSEVTKEAVNSGQMAHIYAFSSVGPRGNRRVPKPLLNKIGNLLLVCHGCHQKIDKHGNQKRYSARLLREWKSQHERRVELVTGIAAKKRSHVVLFGANIGNHSSPLNFDEAAQALFSDHYPAEERPIELGTRNSSFQERDKDFWDVESRNLRRLFDARIRERISAGEIDHLSVFGIAPQPLLILLGTLLSGIPKAEVRQRRREPQTWKWAPRAPALDFRVRRPGSFHGTPALVIALSDGVDHERVRRVLPGRTAIWELTVDQPDLDLIRSRAHLEKFRVAVRRLLDEIQRRHGKATALHVFPVTGVATAIELGRMRMPKAHLPWEVYDQVNDLGGFTRAISIS